MQNIDILRTTYFWNPATGIPSLAQVHSEEINTASSGVSLLHKVLIFCAMLILVTPLLEHHMSGYPHTAGTNTPLQVHLFLLWCTLKRLALPVAE